MKKPEWKTAIPTKLAPTKAFDFDALLETLLYGPKPHIVEPGFFAVEQAKLRSRISIKKIDLERRAMASYTALTGRSAYVEPVFNWDGRWPHNNAGGDAFPANPCGEVDVTPAQVVPAVPPLRTTVDLGYREGYVRLSCTILLAETYHALYSADGKPHGRVVTGCSVAFSKLVDLPLSYHHPVTCLQCMAE